MLRTISMGACLALAMPGAAIAQAEDEADGELNLESVDSLLGDRVVTGDEDLDEDAADEDAPIADGDDPAEPDDAEDADPADSEEATDEDAAGEEGATEPSDLTLAFNAYSLCALEAGTALEESGFALDQIGREALLRCSSQRAAYVNAFYFSLVPRYPDAAEAEVRASAERLVAQSDTAIARMVTGEVTELREMRPDSDEAEPTDEDAVEESAEETEPDA